MSAVVLAGLSLCVRGALGFVAGNLVISEAVEPTSGGVPVAGQADAVVLQEMTTAGSTSGLQSLTINGIKLPDATDHDGQLTLSVNKNVLTIGAYVDTAGAATPTNTVAASADPRVIAVVGANGSVDTSTQLTGANDYPSVSIRQVTSIDGTQFYVSGNQAGNGIGGLRYTTLGANTSATLFGSGKFDSRSATIINGTLYVATGSSNSPDGTGHIVYKASVPALPTITGATFTDATVARNGEQSPVFLSTAGADYMYVVSKDAGGIAKYVSTDGDVTWSLLGHDFVTGTPEALTAQVNGDGSVSLFALTNTNIYSATDTGGTSAINGTFSSILAAPAGTVLRGIAFAPTAAAPEPATIGLAALAGVGLLLRRRSAK